MAKSRNISLIGGLPKPSIESIPLASMFAKDGISWNPREDSKALDLVLLTSLAFDGQKPGHQLTVSIQDDGRALVLCGNRRFWHMTALNAGPVDIKDGKNIRTFKQREFPTVECFVYRGLSPMQEAEIRNDHTGAKTLDEWEKYRATVQLLTLGMTREQISGRMGYKHGTADRLKFRFFMPQEIEDWYYAKTHGQACVRMTQADESKLSSAWTADAASSGMIPLTAELIESLGLTGHFEPTGVEVPGLFKQWGPRSKEVWDNIVAKHEAEQATGERQDDYVSGRGRKHFLDEAESFKAEPWISDTLRYAAGVKTVNLHAIRHAILMFKQEHEKALRLLAVKDEEIADLRVEIAELKERAAKCQCGAFTSERPALESPAFQPEVLNADGSATN